MKTRIFILLWMLTCTVAGYTNNTMTDEYLDLTNNRPIQAIRDSYMNVWGDWFHLLLAIGPFMAMVLYQKNMHIATMWLISILAAYRWLFTEIDNVIFYLIAAVWVMTVLVKALSPTYSN